MKIGVRAHDIDTNMSIASLKEAINNFGFDGLQLVTNKVFAKSIDTVDLVDLKNTFKDQIFLLGAYFNMVHPTQDEVVKGVSNFKKHLDIADSITAPFVGTETGSLMGSPWNYMEGNHSDESFLKVVKVVMDLIEYSKDKNVDVAIEGAWNHVIYSPQRMFQLIQVINSPKLKVIVDLYNFLNINNHENHVEIFKETLDLFSDKVVIFHLKDYIVENGKISQVGLGKGLMNYPEIIKLIYQYNKNAYLIFEGVKKDDMQSSLQFVRDLILINEGGN